MVYLISIILVIILILSIVFLAKNKIIPLMSFGLNVAFIFCILSSLTALFIPWPYEFAADLSLRVVGTKDGIEELDDKTSISSKAESAWDTTIDFFTGDDGDKDEKEDRDGYFEENVYPGLVYSLSVFYRTFAVIGSIAGLVLVIYLSYSVAEKADGDKLESDVRRLKKKVAMLEKRLNG